MCSQQQISTNLSGLQLKESTAVYNNIRSVLIAFIEVYTPEAHGVSHYLKFYLWRQRCACFAYLVGKNLCQRYLLEHHNTRFLSGLKMVSEQGVSPLPREASMFPLWLTAC